MHDKSVIVSCEDDRGIYWETPTENQFIHDGHPLPLLYRQGLVDVGLIVIVLAHTVYLFENALSDWQWNILANNAFPTDDTCHDPVADI